MLRIFTLALIVAFAGSIAPALAQGTTGSTNHAMKGKPWTMNHAKTKNTTKTKKGHKGGKKGKKGSGGGTTQPPK